MPDTVATDVEMVAPAEVVPYTNNPKEHPDEQVRKIASSIKNYGWDQPIVVDGEGEIIKGHGRLQAAELLGLDEVPVIRRTDLSDAEKRAARIADNKTAESGWAEADLELELEQLQDTAVDMDTLGFDDDELDDLLESFEDEDESDISYTDKIKTPTYEPTQDEPPALADLYDTERYEELMDLVDAADVDDGLREFLRLAAQRHVVFDYENIAEYYAHADSDVQEVMEALTLVIVDYDRAVEQGFVTFAEDVLEGVSDA